MNPDAYVQALQFAARKHEGQRVTGSGLPYLVHVCSVASEILGVGGSDLALQCALLHDTVEDTATTLDEIRSEFGLAVMHGVSALTKNAELPKSEQMADSLARIQTQPHVIWIVKLADRITNLAPPPAHWTSEKRRTYREEAIVIADTLGAASPALEARIRARIAAYSRYF
ncbi:MAG TPA: HD domain-containing protein [Kofleriaceae bacterium]